MKLSRAVFKENAAVTRGGATIQPSKESTLEATPANHADADDGCQDSADGCGPARRGDGRASGAHLEGRPAGANADGARRASEDARE